MAIGGQAAPHPAAARRRERAPPFPHAPSAGAVSRRRRRRASTRGTALRAGAQGAIPEPLGVQCRGCREARAGEASRRCRWSGSETSPQNLATAYLPPERRARAARQPEPRNAPRFVDAPREAKCVEVDDACDRLAGHAPKARLRRDARCYVLVELTADSIFKDDEVRHATGLRHQFAV